MWLGLLWCSIYVSGARHILFGLPSPACPLAVVGFQAWSKPIKTMANLAGCPVCTERHSIRRIDLLNPHMPLSFLICKTGIIIVPAHRVTKHSILSARIITRVIIIMVVGRTISPSAFHGLHQAIAPLLHWVAEIPLHSHSSLS